MNKVAVTTHNDGVHDMVTCWDLIPDSTSITNTTEIALANVPQDFYLNFLDYYVVGNTLNKLSIPTNLTMNRPITDTNYPFAAVRANSFNIFESL